MGRRDFVGEYGKAAAMGAYPFCAYRAERIFSAQPSLSLARSDHSLPKDAQAAQFPGGFPWLLLTS